jgi:hypothetical protein
MKTYASRLALALMLCALAVTAAAQGKTRSVTFHSDLTINNVVIKKGDYRVRFDEQAGELTILKGKEVLAKTKAHREKRARKAPATAVAVIPKEQGRLLHSITFLGADHDIVVGGSQAASSP